MYVTLRLSLLQEQSGEATLHTVMLVIVQPGLGFAYSIITKIELYLLS